MFNNTATYTSHPLTALSIETERDSKENSVAEWLIANGSTGNQLFPLVMGKLRTDEIVRNVNRQTKLNKFT